MIQLTLYALLVIPLACNYFATSVIVWRLKILKWQYMQHLGSTTLLVHTRVKPFDCPACMSFWTGLIFCLCWFDYGSTWLTMTFHTHDIIGTWMIMPWASAYMGQLIEKLTSKINIV